MNGSRDKARLDALLEEFKAQPVGWGYIDIIVLRDHYKAFAKAVIAAGFMIESISWWEHMPDERSHPKFGMGGPRSRFYEGWFAEAGEIDDVLHKADPEENYQAVIEIVENQVISRYDGQHFTYRDTPSLTPAFWLDVDESWHNTQET